MRGISGVVVSVALGAAASGCSAARSTDPPPEAGPPPAFTVTDALAQLPASLRGRDPEFSMLMGDLARATELADLDRSGDPAEWLPSLQGAYVDGGPSPVYVPLEVPLAPRSPAEMVEDDLGWSIADVDHFSSWTTSPPFVTTTVVGGDVGAETLSGLPTRDGISTAGTGPDLRPDLETASPARPEGVPLRMAADDGRLVASPLTDVVRDWRQGSGPTLADDPVLSDLAAALDEAGAVSARIAHAPSLLETSVPPALMEQLQEEYRGLGFPEFDTFAVGWTVEDDEPRFVVAYHVTNDPELAVEQIGARWGGVDFRGLEVSEKVEVTDVSAHGDIVVVSGAPEPGKGGDVVMVMSEAPDLPFLSGSGFDLSRGP